MSKESRNRLRESRKRSRSSNSSWEHLANWLQVALVVVVPLALSQELYNYVDLPRGVLIQVGAVLILAIWLMGAVSQGKLRIVRTPFDLPLLGFVLWAGLSLLWASNIYEGLTRWSVWGACLILFFLTVNLIQSERDTRRYLGALVLAGTLVGALGVLQYLLEVDWVLQLVPPAATFGNRNMAAQFMVLTIPLAAGFFLSAAKGLAALQFPRQGPYSPPFGQFPPGPKRSCSFSLQCRHGFRTNSHGHSRHLILWSLHRALGALCPLSSGGPFPGTDSLRSSRPSDE